jgi:WD40 repeat protein
VFSESETTSGTVIFSPDSKTLAAADGNSASGTIQLWDAPTGKPKDPIPCRPYQGVKLAFSPDGKTLAAVGRNGTIERWALPDGKPLKRTAFPAPELVPLWSHLHPIGLTFTDNERVVAWGALFSRGVIWDAPTGKLLTPITGHAAGITGLQFTADGKQVVTLGADFRVLRWDAANGTLIGPVPVRTQEAVAGLTHIAPGATRGLRLGVLYDLKAEEELFALPGAHVSPSGDFTRAAGFRPSPDPETTPTWCEVWDLETRRRLARLELPAGTEFYSPPGLTGGYSAFSPDNSRLVTAVPVRDGPATPPLLITGWDVKTGKKLGEFRERVGHGAAHIATANNNSGVVLATADGKLVVADYERGARGETIDRSSRPEYRITCPTFSPDGKLFAAGVPTQKRDEFAVRVYDWPRGKALHTFTGHRGAITALAFSPDGKTLASGSHDTTVLLWDLSTLPAPK